MDISRPDPAPYFDPLIARRDLTRIASEAGSVAEGRPAVIDYCKGLMREARAMAEKQLACDGNGRRCAEGLSLFQDELVRLIYDYTVAHAYRATNPSDAERMAIVATGGYGRGLMAPGSDIDLLFLLPYKQTPWGESVAEYMLYILWDLGLKVGHSSRSIDETMRMAKADLTVRTALLEARYVWGDRALYEEVAVRFDSEIMQGTARTFVTEKLEERDERHRRMGDSRYVVEPNVKEG